MDIDFDKDKKYFTALGTIITKTQSWYGSKSGYNYRWSDGIDRNNDWQGDNETFGMNNFGFSQIYEDRVRILCLKTMYIEEDSKIEYIGKGYTIKTLNREYRLLTIDISDLIVNMGAYFSIFSYNSQDNNLLISTSKVVFNNLCQHRVILKIVS